LFSGNKGVKSPTLQETARSQTDSEDEDAKNLGRSNNAQNEHDRESRRVAIIKYLNEKIPATGVPINTEALDGLNIPDQKGILSSLLMK
jgi:hypothetical protein